MQALKPFFAYLSIHYTTLGLVNDGSTDKSCEICKKFDKNDSRVHLIEKDNTGVSDSRNRGLEAATGDWIIAIDSDDWIDDSYLEILLSKAEFEELDCVIGNCKRMEFGDGGALLRIEERKAFGEEFVTERREDIWVLQANTCDAGVIDCGVESSIIPLRSIATPWDKLYKANIIRGNHLRYIQGCGSREDILFSMNYLHYCKKVGYIHNYGYNYRILQNSSSHRFREKLINEDTKTIRELFRYLLSVGALHRKAVAQGVYKFVISTIYEHLQRWYFNDENRLSVGERMKILNRVIHSEFFKEAESNIIIRNLTENEHEFLNIASQKDVRLIMRKYFE